MRRCAKGGDPVVHEGDWLEVRDKDGKLVFANRINHDMCQEMLNRYLVFKADIDMTKENEYHIRVRKCR